MTTAPDTPMDSEQLADEAAPLDALLVDAALGPLRRLAPDASTVMFALGLARRPLSTARRLGSLAAELARRRHLSAGSRQTGPPVYRSRLDREPAAAAHRAGVPGGRADG